VNDYATPESGYDLGPGASYELLAELSRALLSGRRRAREELESARKKEGSRPPCKTSTRN
jgi:hypothetical protein